MRHALAILTLFAGGTAWAAGGIEFDEHSAAGVGMAGAQTAIADDPSAIYYNPAGLAFQPGFGALVGGNVIVARTHVSPDNLTLWHTAFAPTIFGAQRFGKYVSFGVGGFAEYGEHFNYPSDWRGRFQGFFIDLTTLDINPTLALRILPGLAIGVGLDVVPGSIEIYRGLQFGGAEGSVHVGADAVGVGGNVGLLVELWPKHFRFGFSYRSRVDLDFTGHGAISAPPELRSLTGGLQTASTTLVLPHHFSAATAFFWGHLALDAELRVSLYHDLDKVTLTLTDPNAPPGAMPTQQQVILNSHNTWALRGGAQYGFLDDRLFARLGVGYDTTPVPTSTLGPLLPDTDRVLVSGGLGYRWHWAQVDVAYMAVILIKETSTNPDLIATYQSLGQVISLSFTARFTDFLQHHPAATYGPNE